MSSEPDPIEPTTPPATISKHMVGPAFLRHYPGYDLVTWQPRGELDDDMLEQIAEWLVNIENVFIPLRRFVDLSELNIIAIRTRHLFDFARKRASEFRGTGSVRTALFCDEWIGLGIARMYESLMANTLIEARAFHDRRHASEWLGVPMEILTLKDEPAQVGNKVD